MRIIKKFTDISGEPKARNKFKLICLRVLRVLDCVVYFSFMNGIKAENSLFSMFGFCFWRKVVEKLVHYVEKKEGRVFRIRRSGNNDSYIRRNASILDPIDSEGSQFKKSYFVHEKVRIYFNLCGRLKRFIVI